MRQFIALTFNSSFKEELMSIMDTLKEEGIQGKYYDLDNLHMTLVKQIDRMKLWKLFILFLFLKLPLL